MDNAFSTLSHKGLVFRVNLTCNLNYLQLYEFYGLYLLITGQLFLNCRHLGSQVHRTCRVY